MNPAEALAARWSAMRRPERAARAIRRRLGLPPAIPSGWSVGPPDFVGVGAQRCGTSWWYSVICDHPGIQASLGKELHFFDRFVSAEMRPDDVQSYYRMLPKPTTKITGEWTPRYMRDAWTPALLSKAAPQAKLIVMLRDPWDRFVSGVRHERRIFRKELATRHTRTRALSGMIVNEQLGRSSYCAQLERLYEHFDRSRILVLQYEACCAEPQEELRRSYQFLGVAEPGHRPQRLTQRVGRSYRGAEMPDELKAGTLPELARDAERLHRLIPEVDLDLWPSVGEGLRLEAHRASG